MEQNSYDVIIVGAGAAGLTAALYTSRARLTTLVLESSVVGGLTATAYLVENYPGFPEGVLGPDLMENMRRQAERFGASLEVAAAQAIQPLDQGFEIISSAGSRFSRAVIIATGSYHRKLGIPGEREFVGRGVSYCAACDGAFFRDKLVTVVGGGNSAIDEALFLTRFAKRVRIVHRRDELRADKMLQEAAFKNEKIEFIWDTVLTAIEGKGKVERVRLKNIKTGEERYLETDGVFIYVGLVPNTGFVADLIRRDPLGLIIVDEALQTSVEGIFAGGDVRAGAVRQTVAACGDGCVAAHSVIRYLKQNP
jgi:thioredoxin reductase (NADPH)